MNNKGKSIRKIKQEPAENPEHNKMQGNFLDDEFCMKFYQLAFPDEIKERKINGYVTVLNKRNIRVDLEEPTGEKYIYDKNFEKDGIDISFRVAVEYSKIIEAFDTLTLATFYKTEDLDTTYYSKVLKIEIIPGISDDYPGILRQMQKLNSNCLYLKEYTGQGIAEDKFVQMFKQQDIIVVFEKELDKLISTKYKLVANNG